MKKVQAKHGKFVWYDASLPFEDRVEALIKAMTVKEKVSQLLDDAPAIERLGIPAYNWWSECLHGVARAGKATVFPQAIAMAATFDVDLEYRMGCAVALEARAKNAAARNSPATAVPPCTAASRTGPRTSTSSAIPAGGAARRRSARTRI